MMLVYGLFTALLFTMLLQGQTALFHGLTTRYDWVSFNSYPRMLADVDGDGKADLVGFAHQAVHVTLSRGSSYQVELPIWTTDFTLGRGWHSFDVYPRALADVDGDGKADIVGFASDGVYVARSNGSAFLSANRWIGAYSQGNGGWDSFNNYPRLLADVNGDGKADIVGFASNGVYVSLSTGSSFQPPKQWSESFGRNQWPTYQEYPRAMSDVDGDGRADVIDFAGDGVYVASSTGSGFAKPRLWYAGFTAGRGGWTSFDLYPRLVADYDADGLGDLIGFASDGVYVALSNRSSFRAPEKVAASYAVGAGGWNSFNTYPRVAADINGDKKADIGGFASDAFYASFSAAPSGAPAPPRNTPYFNPRPLIDPEGEISIIPAPTPNPEDGSGGRVVCGGVGSLCPTEKADYAGEYKDTTACPAGFYDPIYSGSCWQCPADTDGRGGWLRGVPHIEKPDACYRFPSSERLSAAIAVKPGLSWDCNTSENEFWDSQNASGTVSGTCWKCPAGFPRRTSYPVHGPAACATDILETAPATFLGYLGCPAPDANAMGLTPPRMPGRPFRHGFSNACFACPAIDNSGNILITRRNVNPIDDRANNRGCDVSFKWTPPPFFEPGPEGMSGMRDVIIENLLSYPDHVTSLLYAIAGENGLQQGSQAAKTWVVDRWKEIAADPMKSEIMQALVFHQLRQAIGFRPQDRTEAEQRLITAFQAYIRSKRTFMAQQGLHMYDAWAERENTRYKTILELYSAFPTVPLDFHSTIATISGSAAVPGGLLGSAVALSRIAQNVQYVQTMTQYGPRWVPQGSLFQFFTTANVVRNVQFLPVLGGATVIQAAFAAITAIAIDKFIEAVTARDKLLSAVEAAKQPVVMEQFVVQPSGEDQLLYYWGQAMRSREGVRDAYAAAAASRAHSHVEWRGYPMPQN